MLDVLANRGTAQRLLMQAFIVMLGEETIPV